MHLCPSCGSSDIIWDNSRGEIVCSSCGLVIDVIYEQKTSFNSDLRSTKTNERRVSDRRKYHKPGSIVRAYSRLFGWWRLRKNLEVDPESLFRASEGGYSFRVLRHVKDGELMKLLEVSPTMKKIFDHLTMYPRLSSRTFRVKMLISYMIFKELSGIPANASIISRAFSISRNHLQRIRKELNRYPEILKYVSDLKISSVELTQVDSLVKQLALEKHVEVGRRL
ncbi:MAG: TFIIB-type zinc ribbon-containing protein [Sulfolobales archaeon]